MNAASLIIFAVIATPMLAFLGWILWRRWSVVVGSRQAGLVIRRGRATTTTLPTGIHFAAPWNQTVEIYPDYEMTYMTVTPGQLETGAPADADYTDLPFGVIDQDHFTAGILYTLRFTIIRSELKQIHERFGPQGIKGIIRDESRQVIQSAFTEGEYRVIDLGGPSRAALERLLSERIKEQLAANGFALVFFNLREPDLRDFGQLLGEQASARAGLTLEELRARIDEVSNRRLEATARVEAEIESERVRSRATAEADADEERTIRRASVAGKAREIEVAQRLELAAMEAELRLKRAEALARSNSVLAGGLSEILVRLESIESWREVMERWDGRVPPPGLGPGVSVPLPSLGTLPYTPRPGGEAEIEAESHAAPSKESEVHDHGA